MGQRSGCAALVLLALTSISWADRRPRDATDTINSVIGDASWTDGSPENADDSTRIRTHLRYVLDLLRTRDASALARAPRRKRAESLNALERYIERGEFPRRTDDAYAGRRPRFIDDRGVHCAVGHLIADSGEPAVARAIGDSYEYAYVADIDMPAIRTWAVTHGFTFDELATIQPTYEPPDELRIKGHVEHYALDLAPSCAPDAISRATLRVHVEVDTNENSKIVGTPKGSYAKCVLAHLRVVLPHQFRGDQGGKPRRLLKVDVTVELPALQDLFAMRVDDESLASPCFPRPGPIPTSAILEATATPTSIRVVVETQPRNREIEQCMETWYEKMLFRDRPNVGTVRWRRTIPVMMREEREDDLAKLDMDTYTETCPGAPERFTIALSAAIDDPSLTVNVNSSHGDFNTCLANLAKRHLRYFFRANYNLSGFRGRDEAASRAKYREFVRIDTPIDVRLEIARDPHSTATDVSWNVKRVQAPPPPVQLAEGDVAHVTDVGHVTEALAQAFAPDCAPDRTRHSSVQLHVVPSTTTNKAAVSGTATDRYAKCVLDKVKKQLPAMIEGRHYYKWTGIVDVTIDLPGRQDAFQREVDRLWAPLACVPRPGAIPTSATVTATATAGGVKVDVVTQPRNKEVDRCMKVHFTDALASERSRVGTLKASATIPVEPGAVEENQRGLETSTFIYLNDYLKPCATTADKLAITYSAVADAPQLAVAVKGPDAKFDACLAGVLAAAMRPHFVAGYNLKDIRAEEATTAGYQEYFRIDAPIDVRLSVTRDPPMAHDKKPRWTVTRVR